MNCLQYLGTFKIIINKNNHMWKFVKSIGNMDLVIAEKWEHSKKMYYIEVSLRFLFT